MVYETDNYNGGTFMLKTKANKQVEVNSNKDNNQHNLCFGGYGSEKSCKNCSEACTCKELTEALDTE